jgi:hypothetical protein
MPEIVLEFVAVVFQDIEAFVLDFGGRQSQRPDYSLRRRNFATRRTAVGQRPCARTIGLRFRINGPNGASVRC